ncbi:DUF2075 domain-containing protein [Bacillus sp. V59.32b]|uniref:DUF2075 domain-containing protein n=1 Tax=Bacillus sp. V59.32b TaxID=1758642 RepID=UPI000E3E9038|nr:DUF2075 domain-containing protein [Bacillus sp. V59.32b]RFU69995.1 DUF2075 domain-containing protein [Bacillus sp. V59.32b]
MRLYSGTSEQFIEDSIQNQIASKLRESFFDYYRYYPSDSEMASWRNSLRALSQVFQYSGMTDHGILLEYQLPVTSKRLDCMITGKNESGENEAVIIELKQWDKCDHSNGENEVVTWVGGALRDVLHPSAQVGQYQLYLQDTHTAFYDGEKPIRLTSCSYLHNYSYDAEDVLFDSKFTALLNQFPVFTADDVPKLKSFLQTKLAKGDGLPILKKVEESQYRPSKKLMKHVGNTIKGLDEYILLDNQKVIYDKVFAFARDGFHDKRKRVVIIKGGPGTGKSVIALNLLADLSLEGYNSHYATGSKAFTETLRKIIGKRGSVQFKYFNSYTKTEKNEIDILICDEAHRIRKTSNNMYMKKEERSNTPQIEEIIKTSKVSVFFIDDNQAVRPDEIGTVGYINKFALDYGCEVYIEELDAQFRCNGSDGFINWINNTLGIKRTANVIWDSKDDFEFKIFNSPQGLEDAIKHKADNGFDARVTAGFCWPWSKQPKWDGTLEEDVIIGDFKRPWNARHDAPRLAPGIPKAHLWAYDPNGINQVGCIYTAQGFEFDYVGVIIGPDLVYNLDEQRWEGNKEHSYDTVVKRSKEQFIDLVKNTYRVLMTRGMKGCYVHFMDKDTERFFKSRIDFNSEVQLDRIAEDRESYN